MNDKGRFRVNIGLTHFATLAFVLLSIAAAVRAAAPTVTAVTPNSGSDLGGTIVTITGTNFNNPAALSVTFGGSPATAFTVINDTTISATTPWHAPGAVSVVVNNGATNAANTLYTYSSVNPAIQVVAKVTLPKHAELQWGAGTTIDDAGVDHTLAGQTISAYTWVVKDAAGSANVDLGQVYLSTGAGNSKTINVANTSKSNATQTVTAIATNTANWTIGGAAGVNIFRLRASMGAGPLTTLSAAPAQLTNNFVKGTNMALVLEFATPTEISAASASVQQVATVTLTATAN
jgi:hypothetical protein